MKKKSFTDRARNWFNKYLNGWNGVISIFLVLIMFPITSLALTFEEGARYQSAMEMMNEVVDSSAFSSIAEYDSYLDDRFALLATSQQCDINSNFNSYLTQNVKSMGNSVTVNNKKLTGCYSLADTAVLKQQILENSELSVTAQLVADECDVDDLINKLIKKLGLEDLEDFIGKVNDTADLTSSVIEALDKVKDTITSANSYQEAWNAYKDSYNNADSGFVIKVTNLAEKLKTAQNNLQEGQDASEIYNDADVINAIKECEDAAKEYKKKTDELSSKEKSLEEALTGLLGKLQSVSDSIHTNRDNAESDDLAAQCTTSSDEWMIMIVDEALTELNNKLSPNLKDAVNLDIEKLKEISNELGNFKAKDVVTSITTADTIPDKYKCLYSLAIPGDIVSILNNIQDKIDNKGDNLNTTGPTNFLNLAAQIMNLSGLYDSSLDAVLSPSVLYNSNVAQNPSTRLLLEAMTNLINSGNGLIDGVGNRDLKAIIISLKGFLKSAVQFLRAALSWIVDSFVNFITLAASGANEIYNSILLYGYGVYNLPNRVSIDGGKTLYGYSLSSVFSLAGGTYTKSLTGALGDIQNLSSSVSGSDIMFKGAEGEYLVVGSNNEIQNQAATFFDMYMLRLLLNLGPVLTDHQLNSISAMAGPLAWVVKVAAIIVEPMIDCIMLVNGRKVFMWKENVWLSYTGVNCLVQELLECSNISSAFTDKIKDTIEQREGLGKMNGKFLSDYKENLMLLMIISVDQSRYLQRLQNVIQMEGLKKYNNNFSLDKTYTMVKAEVDYTLNPMFNLKGLTNGGLYTKKATKYIGY